GLEQHGEGVVEHAVADGLGDGERADDAPAVERGWPPTRRSATVRPRRHLAAAAAGPLTGRGGDRRAAVGGPGGRVAVQVHAAVADPGLGQVQLYVAGGVPVTGERGDDGAGLLVAGREQERGCATVALHADGVVPG